MYNFIPSLKYELKKIFSRGKYLVLPIFSATLILLLNLVLLFDFTKYFDTNTFKIFNSVFNIGISNFRNYLLSLFSTYLLPLVIFMLAADIFTSEIKNDTIKNILLRPVNKTTIYISKNLAILIYTFIVLMIVFFTSSITTILITKSFTKTFSIFIYYLVTLIPLIPFITFSSFIACKMKSSSSTVFGLTLIYIILGGISLLFSKYSSVFFTNQLGFYKYFTGDLKSALSGLPVFFVLLSTSIIFFIMGNLDFENKNI